MCFVSIWMSVPMVFCCWRCTLNLKASNPAHRAALSGRPAASCDRPGWHRGNQSSAIRRQLVNYVELLPRLWDQWDPNTLCPPWYEDRWERGWRRVDGSMTEGDDPVSGWEASNKIRQDMRRQFTRSSDVRSQCHCHDHILKYSSGLGLSSMHAYNP